MRYWRSDRGAIEDKLEPAARLVAENSIGTSGPDGWREAIDALREVLDELDTFDENRADKRRASTLMRELRRVLIEGQKLTKSTVNVWCRPPVSSWRSSCSFRAGWQLPNGERYCKRHADQKRAELASAAVAEAFEAVMGSKLDYYSEKRATAAQMERIYAKLGVELPKETVR